MLDHHEPQQLSMRTACLLHRTVMHCMHTKQGLRALTTSQHAALPCSIAAQHKLWALNWFADEQACVSLSSTHKLLGIACQGSIQAVVVMHMINSKHISTHHTSSAVSFLSVSLRAAVSATSCSSAATALASLLSALSIADCKAVCAASPSVAAFACA